MWDTDNMNNPVEKEKSEQEPEMIDIPFVGSVEKEEIDKIINQAFNLIETYEPEIKMALNKLVDLGVDTNKRAFNSYINAGFTREEALALVISSNNQMKQGFQNMKSFGGMK